MFRTEPSRLTAQEFCFKRPSCSARELPHLYLMSKMASLRPGSTPLRPWDGGAESAVSRLRFGTNHVLPPFAVLMNISKRRTRKHGPYLLCLYLLHTHQLFPIAIYKKRKCSVKGEPNGTLAARCLSLKTYPKWKTHKSWHRAALFVVALPIFDLLQPDHCRPSTSCS